ncbi:MAG: alanine racemase [Candidatus Eisenbacteria bacterium]
MRSELLHWIEIDSSALRHNLSLFREIVPPSTKVMFVVKANAYGHGLEEVTRLAPTLPIDVLGVHSLDEAVRVREAGWTGPVYVLGYIATARLGEALDHDLDVTIVSLAMLEAAEATGRSHGDRIRCHLKVETGTHRQGMDPSELGSCLELLRQSQGTTLAGLSMHFANIEDTTDSSFARAQLESFVQRTAGIVEEFPGAVRHAACSAAALTLPETSFDLVRVGIGAYGYWPSKETRVSFRTRAGEGTLRPVLSWKTRIGQVREIPSGAYVGYGCTERVARDTRMAVLPVGYSDGFDRGLSRIGHVLVRGRRARVLGRICMNIVMVDVTDIPDAAPEDEVVLLGRSESESIDANDLAALLQTLSYEILARISPTLPRFVAQPE